MSLCFICILELLSGHGQIKVRGGHEMFGFLKDDIGYNRQKGLN